tara:strand:+ start:893 stop:1120 length:228 start_codon:yes stop_codon:yes gene_type:complete
MTKKRNLRISPRAKKNQMKLLQQLKVNDLANRQDTYKYIIKNAITSKTIVQYLRVISKFKCQNIYFFLVLPDFLH